MKQTVLCLLGWHSWSLWNETHSSVWEHSSATLTFRQCTGCRRKERRVPVIRHQPAHWTKERKERTDK